jgi:predicted RNA binding protein YcfA (HicA-like mRNA interferase family)
MAPIARNDYLPWSGQVDYDMEEDHSFANPFRMPQKIRELKAILQKAGFSLLKNRGKGSHTMWEHPLVCNAVILSGKDGNDADRYQARDVRNALLELEQARQKEDEL